MPEDDVTLPEVEAPEFLEPGAALWARITSKYVLRLDELDTLEDVCRIADLISVLESAWADLGCPMLTVGSMKQDVIHPLLGEVRVQRMAKNSLWRQLKLPDEDAVPAANQQRAAATTKWQSRPTRGA